MAVRVLCTGDIHIGRRSSRVREGYRTADAWLAIVDKAIQLEVDLVAISGDIIDQDSKSYEALGPMQHGLSRLSGAGIETVAVAGNHDFDVLPRLASITGTDRFHLLGENGEWERFTLLRGGSPTLHVDGWSFPSEHVRHDPLDSYRAHPEDGVPVLGLLHGDIGVSASSYAPINRQELWAKPFVFTLLGHIHMPQIVDGYGGKQCLYPGSPYALDPGEPGIHGCWIAEIGKEGEVSLQRIPLSPVQYVTTEVVIDDVEDEAGFQSKLTEALTLLARQTSQEYGSDSLKVVSARINATGISVAHRSVDKWIAQASTDLGQFHVGSIHVEVDKLTSSVRPPIDLYDRAKGTDPVGEAAKIILALQEDVLSDPYAELVRTTLREIQAIHSHSGYAAIRSTHNGDSQPDMDVAKEIVSHRAWQMLSLLVGQEEER